MKKLWIFLFLIVPLKAAIYKIETDDYNVGQSVHKPTEGIYLWRADYGYDEPNRILEHCYNDIYAVESTNPDKPLGDNVIGNPIGDFPDYWFRDGPYLFLEIYNSARKITIHSAKKPGVIFRTLITKMYDTNGVRVAYNYTSSTTLTTDVGDYKIRYAIFQCSSVRALDNIVIDYMPVPTFQEFFGRWLYLCSKDNTWCEGCDINRDGIVNLRDYALMFKEKY